MMLCTTMLCERDVRHSVHKRQSAYSPGSLASGADVIDSTCEVVCDVVSALRDACCVMVSRCCVILPRRYVMITRCCVMS
jgi:hypothetical protein